MVSIVDFIWWPSVIAAILGAIIWPFFVFRRSGIDRLEVWLKWLWLLSLLLVIAVFLAIAYDADLWVGGTVMVVSAAVWYAYLAILALCAKRLGKSPIVWYGVTFITNLIGLICAGPMMLGRIDEARKNARRPKE